MFRLTSKCIQITLNINRYKIISNLTPIQNVATQQTIPLNSQNNVRFCSTPPPIAADVRRIFQMLYTNIKERHRITQNDFDHIRVVLDYIKCKKSLKHDEISLLIKCCGNVFTEEFPSVRLRYLQQIWKCLTDSNATLTIYHYNTLLKVYNENSLSFEPNGIFETLKKKQLKPNQYTYNMIIRHYSQTNNIDGALKILKLMKADGIAASAHSYNALVMGYSKMGEFDNANATISQMKQIELNPSSITYTELMCGYAKIGQMAKIHEILEQCKNDQIQITDANISKIIYELAVNGYADRTKSLIEYFRQSQEPVYFRINLILRLTNINQSDLGYKILKTFPQRTRSNDLPIDSGNFFLKQLAKANCSYDQMLSYINKLEQNGRNADPKMVVLRSLLYYKRVDHALKLLHELKAQYMKIEQLYFWPIFCVQSTNEEILNLVKIMKNEFQIDPSVETLKDYVIPNLKNLNGNDMIAALSAADLKLLPIVISLALHQIESNDLKSAADITSQHGLCLTPNLFRAPLVNALNRTLDYENYCILIRNWYDNFGINESKEPTDQVETNKGGMLGMIIYDALYKCSKCDRNERAQTILRFCCKENLSISESQATRIRAIIGTSINELTHLLDNLVKNSQSNKTFGIMSHHRMETLRNRSQAGGETVNGLNRILLQSYRNANDAEQYEKLLLEVESGNSGFYVSDKIYIEMMLLHAQYGDVEKVATTLIRAKALMPEFSIGNSAAIKIAALLADRNALQPAIHFLTLNKNASKKNCFDLKRKFYNSEYEIKCYDLVNKYAELGKASETETIFDCLTKNNYISVSHDVAALLIKVHLINDDLVNAAKAFKQILKTYDITPMLNQLLCALIMTDNTTELNEIVSLTCQIHNKLNCLLALAVAYVECARMDDAIQTLAQLNLSAKFGVEVTRKLAEYARVYFNRGQEDALERLIEVTKAFNEIKRNELYHYLILSYCKDALPTRALDLWVKMEKENVTCNDDSMYRLGNYLQSKNVSLPFKLPNLSCQSDHVRLPKPPVDKLLSYLNDNQTVTQAIIKENLNSILTDENLKKCNNILGKLLVENRLNEAKDIAFKILANNSIMNLTNIKIYLTKIAEKGDYKTLIDIRARISSLLKKKLSMNNRICKAYVACGRANEYINGLLRDFEEAESTNCLKVFMQDMPLGGLLLVLEEHPELMGQIETLLHKAAENNYLVPLTILWSYHFNNGNDERANTIWLEHIRCQKTIAFKYITQKAIQTQNVQLAKKLVYVLESSLVSDEALSEAHSCLLDVYAANEQFEEGARVIDTLKHQNKLKFVQRDSLKRIRNGLAAVGKSFLYKM